MEELTKQQIILLGLLVSFVTSIATGIITVALMDDQGTTGVTQTFNRVVERTIEKVVPEKGQGAAVLTKEVVVKEENMIIDSVDKASKSLVRIKKYATSEGIPPSIVSLGVSINKNVIAASADNIYLGNSYYAILPDGTEVKVEPFAVGDEIAFLKRSEEGSKDFATARFADSEKVRLGQTAVMIYGRDRNVVSLGIISDIEENQEGKNIYFDANVDETEIMGSPIIDIFGETVGLRVSTPSGKRIIASNVILSILANVTAE